MEEITNVVADQNLEVKDVVVNWDSLVEDVVEGQNTLVINGQEYCDKCQESFTTRTKFTDHKRHVHESILECGICQKVF